MTKVSVKEDGKMEKEREEQVISLCQKLIQQKSYSGRGERSGRRSFGKHETDGL